MLQVTAAVGIPDDELEWSYARSGGPGGQNVNKVASKALLRWRMEPSPQVIPAVKDRIRALFPSRCTLEGDVLVVAQRYRDQERNRQDCLEKLGDMVRIALRPPTPRKVTKPSKGAKRRRVADKRRQSDKKESRRGGGGGEE